MQEDVQSSSVAPAPRQAAALRATLVALVCIELAGIFMLPLVLPEKLYLRAYIGSRAVAAADEFVKGRNYLIPDPVLGWRNAPNYSSGKWITDSLGSRSAANAADNPGLPLVVFLGSSLVNGGITVSNDESISARLPGETYQVLNFGTMLYSLDQVTMQYENFLQSMPAKHVVLGVSSNPAEYLSSVYIPLVNREEVHMPFLKPRFTDSGVKAVAVDPGLISRPDDVQQLLSFIYANDARAWRYRLYRRSAFTPLAMLARTTTMQVLRIRSLLRRDPAGEARLQTIMTRLQEAVARSGADLTLVCFPSRRMVEPGRLARFLPDLYGERIVELRAAGFQVVDVRAVLRDAGPLGSTAWAPDGFHLSAAGNAAVAAAIASRLDDSDPGNRL